ncbi:beta-ketoacyl synthase domain-containing protein [Colletotrichum graminicola M1.001]|uniref:Beta-ketoacyl synthase domain-containing protein n=1 Tax=Colletotrichum graminicola (strain M1.001 / M2 / FGSC 10212) TaxID=645133 RepID=E3QJI0_COLGM|nr:beta-ketoacyl synthase domain-containing protein [Colletotrichum graminicola M1.001]EFQ31018.1 beta-ketoacyl synthase domain-containing protein [Colletotrichum graminicola M1.001]
MYNDTTHDIYSACDGKGHHSDLYEPIAIIGMGMRLPGHVHNATDYWDLLVKGNSGRCPVPKSRYNVNNWYGPGRVSHVPTKFGYFLEELNLAHVDPSFWSFTKQEAELMDPRQRLFLEVAYEALENSGSKSWKGNDVGVYVGTMGEDWTTLESRDERNLNAIRPDVFGDYILANRASYEFDLTGPSVVVRTACSASLVALHQACQDLHSGDCSSALVGGVNLILTPKETASMHQNGVLSPSGSCKSFDADADGFARGEGVSAIYIKRLSDAVRDGDPIRSVIRSTCTAGNGRTLGLTTPNPEIHERLMRRGHRLAGVTDLSKTAMVECHGTGTPVGDPLEVSAVANIWGENGIYIGSVKPNIGHGEGAAGLSSVIKMVLALENSTIPPNINFKTPNPRIPWETARLKVPTEPLPWPTDRCERVSVNGFGIGGSNAHVSVDVRVCLTALILYQVLLESTTCFGLPSIRILNKSNPETPYHRLLAFSAKHPDSVKSLTNKVENYLNQSSGSLNNVAYSLAARREIHTYRAFCVTDGSSALQISPVIKRKCSTPDVVWVFTGQGAQWAQMGKELIEQEPLFGERIDSLDKILAGLSEPPSWTIKGLLVASEDESRLSEAEFSQPCLLAIQVALVDLLRSWGVVPSAVVGHSSGETAAAYASGAITAEEAILIAYHRGQITRLIKAVHNGSMAAVGLGRHQAEKFLRPGVIVGCENSPSNVTLSGESDVLQDVLHNIRLKNPEVLARALRVECGYHSHHMKTAAEDFTARLEGLLQNKKPCVPFYSSVTGVKNTDMSHSYWVNNVLSPVLFSTAVQSVLDDFTSPVFVEIGPHSALAGPIRQILQFKNRTAQYIPTLMRSQDAMPALLKTAGELWLAGTTIDIAIVNPPGQFLTDLPTYPWHYDKEYWLESRLSRSWRFRKFPHHELLGSRVEEISDALPSWRCNLRLDDVSWLGDHVVRDQTIFPASGFISMIGEALRQLTGSGEFTLSHVSFEAVLVLDDRPVELVTVLHPAKSSNSDQHTWYDFSISSLGEENERWVKHVSGQCRAGSGKKRLPPQMSTLPRQVSASSFYNTWKRFGLNYGSSFRGLSGITSHVTEPKAVATLDDMHSGYSSAVYSVHPATLDTSMHVAMVASCKGLERNFRQLVVPIYLQEMFVRKTTGPIQVIASAESLPEAVPLSKVVGVSERQVVIEISGLQVRALENSHSNEEDPHAGAVLEWKPDINFVSPSQLLHQQQTDVDSHVLDRMVLACIVDLRAQIQFLPATQPHLVKFKHWLDASYREAMTGQYPGVINSLEIATMSHKVRHAFIVKMLEFCRGTIFFDIAHAVYRVHIYGAGCFSGSSHAVKTLAQPEHLTGFLRFIDDVDFSNLLQLLGHKNPNMSILHIHPAAESTDISSVFLSPDGERTYGTYTYTGVSIKPTNFIERRCESSSAVKYKKLAIEEDPIPQGFAEESFDLIISQQSTASFSPDSIINMRRLLKPRGYLILQRPNPASKVLQLAFGLVPEINLGSESPLQPEALREQLRLAGFDDASSATFTGEGGRITVAQPCQYYSKPVRASVVCQDSSHPIVSSATMFLQSRGISLQYFPPGHRLPRGQPILCLLDLESPFLHNMGPAQWNELKKSLFSAQDEKMLWVTGASQMHCKDPNYSLTLGAARSVRRELAMDLATLELEFFNVHGWDAVVTVLKSFGGRFRGGEVDSDSEYVFSNGSIQICRFHSTKVMDNLRERCDNAPKTLNIVNVGSLQTLRWEETEGVGLDRDNLRIEVRAAGVDTKDLHASLSDVSSEAGLSSKFGLEGSGIVTGVGPDARKFRIGDRVAFNHDSALSTSIILSESLCAEIPATMGFEEAASTPYSFGLVLHGLMELGKLKKGQSVLIHSASDALGAAAINVARLIGAEIFCTVRTSEQAKYLMSSYEIPKTRIFSCGDASFSHEVLQLTAGVDVVFNTLPEFLQESWDCLSPLGTLVHVVQHRAHSGSHLRMDRSSCNRTFVSVDFEDLRINRPRECIRLLEQAFTLNKFGLNNPAPEILTFKASDVALAFQHLQSDKHVGRVVVRMPRSSGELQALPLRSKISLRHDRTYIIVGGAGGLGQATGRFLVERGARNLIFFSRSAEEASKNQPQYFMELEYLGCRVQAISGSVDKMADVVRMMDSVSSPVAGVLNAAMVLHDTNLADMTFEEWQATVSPKVQGTWNLHYALQAQNEPLDFFFLFSSLSGLGGQIGQANYAAGNAFLDAFVQYRHSQGLPCSVLDIGIMEDIGVLARETSRLEALRKLSQHCLHEQDLLDAMELMIQRSNGRLDIGFEQGNGLARGYINPSQLAIGMRSSASTNRTGWQRDPRTLFLTSAASTNGQAHDEHETGSSLREFIQGCASDPGKLSSDEAKQFLAKEIGGALRGFMMRQDAEVNLSLPLQTDSLVTVELRNWFRQKLGVVFTVVELRSAESILALGGLAAAKLSVANM